MEPPLPQICFVYFCPFGIGATIRIGREIQCLPYAGFFVISCDTPLQQCYDYQPHISPFDLIWFTQNLNIIYHGICNLHILSYNFGKQN